MAYETICRLSREKTWWVLLVEQELPTLPVHWVHSCFFIVWFMLLNLKLSLLCLADHCLSFFFWPLHCLSFDLWVLITPLVSSNHFYIVLKALKLNGLQDLTYWKPFRCQLQTLEKTFKPFTGHWLS